MNHDMPSKMIHSFVKRIKMPCGGVDFDYVFVHQKILNCTLRIILHPNIIIIFMSSSRASCFELRASLVIILEKYDCDKSYIRHRDRR